MPEYRIIIKLLDGTSSTNDLFLSKFVQKIEELGLQYGGIFYPETQIHVGVIDFISDEQFYIEKNIKEIQSWLATYPVRTIVLAFFPLTCANTFLQRILQIVFSDMSTWYVSPPDVHVQENTMPHDQTDEN